MYVEPLDFIPLWCFFLLTVVIGMLSVEAGYRFGRRRNSQLKEEKDGPVAAIVPSIVGLLALMLAFTFNMAATRFDARRQAVLEEANSIGTTYLRTSLLPEPQRSKTAELLRSYTEMRVECVATGDIARLLSQSNALHAQLWSQATAAAEKSPSSLMTGLFVQSLNGTIDLHSKRVFVGLESRIPHSIWLTLFALTIIGIGSVGYQAGLSATRRSPEMPVLALAFAVVMFLIVDLDRAHQGMLQVNQQPMIDLLETMSNTSVTQP